MPRVYEPELSEIDVLEHPLALSISFIVPYLIELQSDCQEGHREGQKVLANIRLLNRSYYHAINHPAVSEHLCMQCSVQKTQSSDASPVVPPLSLGSYKLCCPQRGVLHDYRVASLTLVDLQRDVKGCDMLTTLVLDLRRSIKEARISSSTNQAVVCLDAALELPKLQHLSILGEDLFHLRFPVSKGSFSHSLQTLIIRDLTIFLDQFPPFLNHLDIRGCNLVPRSESHLIPPLPYLETLLVNSNELRYFSHNSNNPVDLTQLTALRVLQQVKAKCEFFVPHIDHHVLKLPSLYLNDITLIDCDLREVIFSRYPRLVHLSLTRCHIRVDQDPSPNIQTVVLYHCHCIHDNDVTFFDLKTSSVKFTISQYNELSCMGFIAHVVDMRQCDDIQIAEAMDRDILVILDNQAIKIHLPRASLVYAAADSSLFPSRGIGLLLRSLWCTHCRKLTLWALEDASFENVLRFRPPYISHLVLQHSYFITLDLEELLTTFDHLAVLEVRYCTIERLVPIPDEVLSLGLSRMGDQLTVLWTHNRKSTHGQKAIFWKSNGSEFIAT